MTVLKGLNLDFSLLPAAGRFAGANGCGKSTLFMNLSGLLRPQKAVLWQENRWITASAGLLALRQQVGDGFSGPNSRFFYTDIDSDIAFSLRNLGCRGSAKSRAASTRR